MLALTIGRHKPIGGDSQSSSDRVQAIDLVRQARHGAEVLPEAVQGVGKVDVLVTRVDGHVVEGVELSTKVVVYKNWESMISKRSKFEVS